MNITTSTTPRIFIPVNHLLQQWRIPASHRLLGFWEVRNVKKGGELMHVDILLLEEKLKSSSKTREKCSATSSSVTASSKCLTNLCFNKELSCDQFTRLLACFPYNIEIRPPLDKSQLLSWKNRLEDDMKMVQFKDNKNQRIS
ncbi:hypothetical protein F2Q68_00021858 [Brassica cretica]|uniref:Uncharacterized protein n=1 Tax=Brassica cretica TaxID=69181 RepID=A0A8S9FQZ9_BRACR|nr:hypothetical protein F2Q68_00021858 [Brassica cretica]